MVNEVLRERFARQRIGEDRIDVPAELMCCDKVLEALKIKRSLVELIVNGFAVTL